jgi:hypothetical protein
VRIDINELEILAPSAPAEPDADTGAPQGSSPHPPAPDLGERLRHWHREARTREHRLMAD